MRYEIRHVAFDCSSSDFTCDTYDSCPNARWRTQSFNDLAYKIVKNAESDKDFSVLYRATGFLCYMVKSIRRNHCSFVLHFFFYATR